MLFFSKWAPIWATPLCPDGTQMGLYSAKVDDIKHRWGQDETMTKPRWSTAISNRVQMAQMQPTWSLYVTQLRKSLHEWEVVF